VKCKKTNTGYGIRFKNKEGKGEVERTRIGLLRVLKSPQKSAELGGEVEGQQRIHK
jgi:hypothetical protein